MIMSLKLASEVLYKILMETILTRRMKVAGAVVSLYKITVN